MTAQWHILGPELRAAREKAGVSLRSACAVLKLSPSTLSFAERGGPSLGREALRLLAAYYAVDLATSDRWISLAGHLPPDLEQGLLRYHDRWRDVRVLLGLIVCDDKPSDFDAGYEDGLKGKDSSPMSPEYLRGYASGSLAKKALDDQKARQAPCVLPLETEEDLRRKVGSP